MPRTHIHAPPRKRIEALADCLECEGGVYVGTDYPTCHRCGHVMPVQLQAVFQPPRIVVLVA